MRKLLAGFIVTLVVACTRGTTPQPVDVAAPAPESTAVTMECVTRELETFGYEVPEGDADANEVTGIRINEPPWFLRWLYGNTADQITAVMEDDQLRVTPSSTDPNGMSAGPPTQGASQATIENAETIVETCGEEA